MGHRLLGGKDVGPHRRAAWPSSTASASFVRDLARLPGGLSGFLPCFVE